jgi:hypothetical protein
MSAHVWLIALAALFPEGLCNNQVSHMPVRPVVINTNYFAIVVDCSFYRKLLLMLNHYLSKVDSIHLDRALPRSTARSYWPEPR